MIRTNSAIFMRVSGVLAIGLTLGGCGARQGQEIQEVPPGITFEGFRFRAYRGTALAASGQAERASFRRDSTDLQAETITVRLPGRPGEADTVLTSATAQGNLRASELTAAGGVTATRGPVTARTARVRWDGSERLIQGEEPVTLRGPGYLLHGPGFELDPDAGTVQITGPGTFRAGRGVGR
jgi:hypothetical protein